MKGQSEPVRPGDGQRRSQALSADRSRRRRWPPPPRWRAAELHPWNCPPGEPEQSRAGWCSTSTRRPMSPSTRWSTPPRRSATGWRPLGLVAFCKTTGGKGLHVVTPLKAGRPRSIGPPPRPSPARSAPRWPPTAPDRYLVNMAKAQRGGRIFLDYLRNDRMAPPSRRCRPRARPGATVSMPLAWSQVRKGLDPDATRSAPPRRWWKSSPRGTTTTTARGIWRTRSSGWARAASSPFASAP